MKCGSYLTVIHYRKAYLILGIVWSVELRTREISDALYMLLPWSEIVGRALLRKWPIGDTDNVWHFKRSLFMVSCSFGNKILEIKLEILWEIQTSYCKAEREEINNNIIIIIIIIIISSEIKTEHKNLNSWGKQNHYVVQYLLTTNSVWYLLM